MKKSLLALAVFGAFAGAAQAQSSVTIYGIVDEGLTYTSRAQTTGTNTGSQFAVNSGVIQGSRLGFKGTEDLGGGLSAIFALEAGFSADTGALSTSGTGGTSTLFRRKSYVGLGGGFGNVTVGRQTDFADTISAFTSVNDFGGVTGTVGHNLDRLEGTRTNNSVAYTTNNLNGFTGNLIYGFGETAGSTSDGQAFGLAGQYVNGPLGLGLNYYQSKAGTGVGTTADTGLLSSSTLAYTTYTAGQTAAKVLNAVASYQFGPARVYANYSLVKQPQNTAANLAIIGVTSTTTATSSALSLANAEKAQVFEIGTAYSLSAALKLLASVDYTKANFDGISNTGKLTELNLGTDYSLSQRTDLYAFVSDLNAKNINNPGIMNNGTGQDGSQIAVTVGVRHKF